MVARRADHTREELTALALDAAEDLVVERGLEGLTARKVAERIGYSPGTLYNIFENLDDLVVHVNARTLEALKNQLGGIDRTGDAGADLMALARTYYAFSRKHPHRWTILFEYIYADTAHLPGWYKQKIQALTEVPEAVLKETAHQAARDPKEAGLVFWSSLHGICSLAASGKLGNVTDKRALDMITTLVDIFVTGLKSSAEADKSETRTGSLS